MSTSKRLPRTPAPMGNMKRVNHFMPLKHIEGLDTVAKAEGGTASDHLRKAVQSYLRRHKIPV